MTKQELRNEFITGSFMIGEGGLKEPPDWKKYSEKLEIELMAQDDRNTALHLRNIKNKTEGYKEFESLRSRVEKLEGALWSIKGLTDDRRFGYPVYEVHDIASEALKQD